MIGLILGTTNKFGYTKMNAIGFFDVVDCER